MNKRLRNGLQNAALILLTISALFLLLQTQLLPDGWISTAASPPVLTAQPVQPSSDELSGMLGSMHIMITADSEYGRCGQLCAGGDDALLQQITPLFREALGSAAGMEASTHQAFQEALNGVSIYLDLLSELPLTAAAVCLGENAPFDRTVRSLTLTAETDSTAFLYLRSEKGSLFRCTTALPVSAVRDVCAAAAPNGSSFAYESNYTALAPYTILAGEVSQPPDVQADLPAGCTAYNLLTALDFNPHTNSRYTDRDGAEVIEESPRTLRISPDGTAVCTSAGIVSLPLYRVACPGEKTEIRDALRAAWRIASALTAGVGGSPLYLHAAEETETGYVIRFHYQAGSVPVCFTDESDALSVTISGASVTALTYRCRSYTPIETDGDTVSILPLLPPSMAASIASLYPDGGLEVAYVDGGSGRLSASWLAN